MLTSQAGAPEAVAEAFASRMFAAGKSAAALKESHLELAQNYRTVAKSERRLQKTVGGLQSEVAALRAQLQLVANKPIGGRDAAWHDMTESKREERGKSRLEEVLSVRLEELAVRPDIVVSRPLPVWAVSTSKGGREGVRRPWPPPCTGIGLALGQDILRLGCGCSDEGNPWRALE
jgi:hypothetical protein